VIVRKELISKVLWIKGTHFPPTPPSIPPGFSCGFKNVLQGAERRTMRTLLLACACVASACAAGAVGSSPTLRQGRAGTVLQGQKMMKGARSMALRGGAPQDEVRLVYAFAGVHVVGRAGGRACMPAFACVTHDPCVLRVIPPACYAACVIS
jgi:hypothetical protein